MASIKRVDNALDSAPSGFNSKINSSSVKAFFDRHNPLRLIHVVRGSIETLTVLLTSTSRSAVDRLTRLVRE